MYQETRPQPGIILNGEKCVVEKFYISELGYLMMKTYSESTKTYTTYNLGTHNPEENIFKDAIEKR
jgi:hypothetical protein